MQKTTAIEVAILLSRCMVIALLSGLLRTKILPCTLLFVRPVVFVVSVARVRDGETAVGPGCDLDVIYGSFVRDACRWRAANAQVGDELLWRIVVPGVNRIVQLPEVLQTGRFLEGLESSHRS